MIFEFFTEIPVVHVELPESLDSDEIPSNKVTHFFDT